jgi:chromosomal replication initiator protein
VTAQLDHLWPRIRAELAAAVDHSVYRVWLEPLQPVELAGDRLLLSAPDRTAVWVGERFATLLETCTSRALGRDMTVEVVAATPARASSRRLPSHAPGPDHEPAGYGEREAPANPKLTFEHFVIGDSNRLAHAAALTVAEMPAQAYNPLFICGAPGLGKTHLLQSIAAYVQAHGDGLTVRLTTGEAFTNEFLIALRGGDMDAFKARFRSIDVLLVDDVQFLERKTRTEEEFFHTFNVLTSVGSQVVLTSDRPPRDLEALEDRLRERFQSGLVAEISPPDLSTREAILRKRVASDQLDVSDDDLLRQIAAGAPDNVRGLEGALIRVVAFASLAGRPLTADLAREVIAGLYSRDHRAQPTLNDIRTAACELFDVSSEKLMSADRRAVVAWPRHVAMYASRQLTDESLPAIGRFFGGRDHTTVLHACRRTAKRMADDPDARADVAALLDRLGGPHPDRST